MSENPVYLYILGRLKEPSTWAGIAVFLTSYGLSDDTIQKMVSNGPALVAGIAALIAILAPSRGRKALEEAREAKAIATETTVQVQTLLGEPMTRDKVAEGELIEPMTRDKTIQPGTLYTDQNGHF